MKPYYLLLFLFSITMSFSQGSVKSEEDLTINKLIPGTLLIPESKTKPPLVIFFHGSGAIDRNGNEPKFRNNSLKYLAEGLCAKKIASFRFDKRLVTLMKDTNFNEDQLKFNDYIKDARTIIRYFENDPRFSGVYVLGHSQGSLIGMVAAQDYNVKGFISIAGAGQEIDDVIVDQLKNQAPEYVESARKSFDDLRVYGFVNKYDDNLASIFRPSLQYFMYTWMHYNPQTEIAKLKIPVLIINGDKDLQVQVSEAIKLKNANPNAKMTIIKNMNHVFKEVKGDWNENQETYNNIELPNSPKLSKSISSFILK